MHLIMGAMSRGHDPRPCTCVQSPEKSTPRPSCQDQQLELVAAAPQRRPHRAGTNLRHLQDLSCATTGMSTTGTKERAGMTSMRILGTSITCTAIGRTGIRKASNTLSTICGTGRIKNLHQRCKLAKIDPPRHAAPPCSACQQPQTEVLAASPPGSSSRLKRSRLVCVCVCGGRGGSRIVAPSPRPWQSSVLVRSGAYSLPGPLRRSSAHVSTMSGAVAAVVAVQLQNRAAR